MNNQKGFSLVELILSVGIAAILMVGISAFFGGTFRQMFQAQAELQTAQKQFIISAILHEKLADLQSVAAAGADWMVGLNRPGSRLPLMYIGAQDNRLVFKDWFAMNKAVQTTSGASFYSGSDTLGGNPVGAIKKAVNGDSWVRGFSRPFGGFAIDENSSPLDDSDDTIYIALPDENKIVSCPGSPTDCVPTDVPVGETLSNPIDVTTDGGEHGETAAHLFISDSGSGRVLKVNHLTDPPQVTELASDLNFPTGLAYDPGTKYLFVAESGAGRVLRIATDPPGDPMVIAGLGDEDSCAGAGDFKTARYCKLSFPTGLTILLNNLSDPLDSELLIADSGNNRIVRISDPGRPDAMDVTFTTKAPGAIQRIEASFPAGVDLSGATIGAPSIDPANPKFITGFEPAGSTAGFSYPHHSSLQEDTLTTNYCELCGAPDPLKIKVADADHSLFRVGDAVWVQGEAAARTVASTAGGLLELSAALDAHHGAGEKVFVANDIPTGHTMTFPVTGMDASGVTDPFSIVQVTAYDLADSPAYDYARLVVGNGRLGDFNGAETDDVAAVEASAADGLAFPTSATAGYIANTGEDEIIKRSDGSQTPLGSFTPEGLAPFDYVSEFLLDVNGLLVQPALQGGSLLQITLRPILNGLGQTYIFNAKTTP